MPQDINRSEDLGIPWHMQDALARISERKTRRRAARGIGHARVSYLTVYARRDGRYGWRQKAKNGEVIAQGQGYTRRRDAVRGANRAVPDGVWRS